MAPGSGGGKSARTTVAMPSGAHKNVAIALVAYESKLRGCSKGQACYEMVMEAADVGSYPQQVRDRIESLEAASRAYASERAFRPPRGGGRRRDR